MRKLLTANSSEIPFIGLGTFPFQGREMADMIKKAVKTGYRLFDTADDYRGETGIGLAIDELRNEGVCKREDLFLQTKISDNNAHADEPLIGLYFNSNNPFMSKHTVKEIVREKVAISLRSMHTSYIDALLIHYPYPEYFVEIWKEMILLKQEGIVRHIGVSNFHVRHMERLLLETGVSPEINEIYISPISVKEEVINYCIHHDCIPMTYSPLMDMHSNRIPSEVFNTIMTSHHKSLAQIILRWNIERGCLPLPKTRNEARLKENFSVFDFELSTDETNDISALNKNFQYLVESKICPGL